MFTMKYVSPGELKSFPNYSYYRDELKEDEWKTFLDGTRIYGLLESVVTTDDNIILYGHDTVRAALELEIYEIPVTVKKCVSEEDTMRSFLELNNFFGRNKRKENPKKSARCYKELMKIYGIRQGSRNPKGVVVGEPVNGETYKRLTRDM